MRLAKEIQNFFYGQYFADGIRIALGTLIPALLFAYFVDLQVGLTVSLGAMLVGLADTPGSAFQRRNGMLVTLVLVLVTSLITNLVNDIPWMLLLVIVGCSFFYSMFAVYGARSATVGAMGILAIVLNTDTLEGNFQHTLEHIAYFFVGGVWYFALSSSVTQARPYRLAQQELGESIHKVAEYIRIKANFYDVKVDNQKNFRALIDQQVLVNEHQDNVREMLFRSKKSVRDSTAVGRMLVLVFTDIIDLFEQSMATHYDYDAINERYGSTGILREFKITIIRIGNELDNLGYEIIANRKPKPLYNFKTDLERLKQRIEEVETKHGINVLLLKKILINIRNMIQRIDHLYSYFDSKPPRNSNNFKKDEADYSKFVESQRVDPKVLRENMTLRSSIFRHAVRMAAVMGVGYIIAVLFNVGQNSHWILLTIMVILKPGFGLTKQRNFQRLTGTIIGGIGGVLILMLVHDKIILFVILLFLVVATYSLIRINYIVAVMFMTPYVLIMFSFFETNTFLILRERIIDTIIGSALAFGSSYIILPNWERYHLNYPMRKLLIANYRYIAQILQFMGGQALGVTATKLARQEVHIATANMGSAFQRLLTEPKSQQKEAKEINKFVVLNHILSSFSVPLLHHVQQADSSALTSEQVKLIRQTMFLLAKAINSIERTNYPGEEDDDFTEIEVSISTDLDKDNIDSQEQTLITEQLNFLKRIAEDLTKLTEKIRENGSEQRI